MYTITVNSTQSKKVEILEKKGSLLKGTLNEQLFEADIIQIKEGVFHCIKDYKSYTVEVVKLDAVDKKLVLKVNNHTYRLDVKDKYDELLHTLGLDSLTTKKVNDIKAPMPGMVLNVLVSEGQEVKKGDTLLILEAMKMENVLKSPTDGIIKKIAIEKGMAVEKNQLMIQF